MSKSKTVMKNLLSLLTYILNLVDDSELNEFDQEERKICIDEKLPYAFDSNGHEVKCLDWWIKIPYPLQDSNSYTFDFSWTAGRENFSEMKDVIDLKPGRMDIATFDAIQTMKYSLRQQVIGGSYLFILTCILRVVNTPNFRAIQRKCYFLQLLNTT